MHRKLCSTHVSFTTFIGQRLNKSKLNLPRAQRCAENACGILASRWPIYDRRINLEPENAENVVKDTCVLHNFLCISTGGAAHYCPPGYAYVEYTFGNVREGSVESRGCRRGSDV
ncbi:hypothetical protein HPB48_021022 [Haemaphysalis longicornis]|uniref:Uncharacterized protein n=1 Tax=Haemaphysalis longicornis TaxID=44386 RepID=A0A9J6GIP5_HAELO|nr:hypothetical protein HPB48_021022 [Haemaphysalis longicornis]